MDTALPGARFLDKLEKEFIGHQLLNFPHLLKYTYYICSFTQGNFLWSFALGMGGTSHPGRKGASDRGHMELENFMMQTLSLPHVSQLA